LKRALKYVYVKSIITVGELYWAAVMNIYFIQRPAKTIVCITFYLLPRPPTMRYHGWSWPIIRTRSVWIA